MFSDVEESVVYKILNTPMNIYPYPHFYVESVFPEDFYLMLRANWPDTAHLTSISETARIRDGHYKERFVLPLLPDKIATLPVEMAAFWQEASSWLLGDRFLQVLIQKFQPYIDKRFGSSDIKLKLEPDALVVRDFTNYEIGPHTDLPIRLLSLLFYCPGSGGKEHLGTSIYRPVDTRFTCEEGQHYPFDKFRRITTMKYRPNSLFVFMRTNNSFHGVEKIKDKGVMRDLLLYNVRISKVVIQNVDEPEHVARRGFVDGLLSRIMR